MRIAYLKGRNLLVGSEKKLPMCERITLSFDHSHVMLVSKREGIENCLIRAANFISSGNNIYLDSITINVFYLRIKTVQNSTNP